MFNTWKTWAVAARMKSLSAGLFALLCAVLLAGLPAAAAPAATSTTLAVMAGGNPVTTVASGTVVTLTATVLAGATPVSSGPGELLRRHSGLLRGHSSSGLGAIDDRGDGSAEVHSRHRQPHLQGGLCGDNPRCVQRFRRVFAYRDGLQSHYHHR